MSSPVFTENSPFARGTQTPNAGEVMTLQNTMNKSVMFFGLTLVTMAIGWLFLPSGVALVASLAAFVLVIVATFKKEPSPALYTTAIGLYGLAIGVMSKFLETRYEGVVGQAVLATIVVIAVVFALYRSGRFRSSPRMTKIFTALMVGYIAFSLINLGLMLTGLNADPWGMRSSVEIFGIPLGLLLGGLAILLGAYSLVLDFEFIENGVRMRIPEKYGWTAAFGLMLTIIWLYVEILRVIAIARN